MVVEIRPATDEDLPAVMTVLDGGLLEVTPSAVREGETLVAVAAGQPIGAVVLADARVRAIAVRPRRRNAGIGTALIEAAAARHGRLEAEFDDAVRPFYESLDFAIEPAQTPGRWRGVRPR